MMFEGESWRKQASMKECSALDLPDIKPDLVFVTPFIIMTDVNIKKMTGD